MTSSKTKTPHPLKRAGDAVFHPQSMQEQSYCDPFNAESQPSLHRVRAGFLASGSLYLPRLPIHHLDSGDTRGVRQRLQRRDRNGVAPFSLLSFAAPASLYQTKIGGLLRDASPADTRTREWSSRARGERQQVDLSVHSDPIAATSNSLSVNR
jgi:hypothetical protein